MIQRLHTRKQRGFSLVELAIVLGISGVLLLGLYRIMSGGNQQTKDTAVASQQIQLINAVKTFLASTQGANWMGTSIGAPLATAIPSKIVPLPLPTTAPDGSVSGTGVTNAPCKTFTADVNLQTFCDALPVGFSKSTINAYGQSYGVQIVTGPTPAGASAPPTYTFMIQTLTTANETIIPDADGGRISGQIGADGGFNYSPGGGCGTNACGSYGAWTASPTAVFGFPSAPVGHIASRTYVAPEANSTLPWLSRLFIDAPGTTAPTYNTMHTDLFLGTNAGTGASNKFWLGSDSTLTTGGGTINLQQGGIADSSTNGYVLKAFPNVLGPKDPASGNYYLSAAATGANPIIQLNSNCTADGKNTPPVLHWNGTDDPSKTNENTGGTTTNDCPAAVEVQGDANVVGLLQATALYAGGFIYNASDMRLKRDIQPIQHALDNVMRMKPVSFAFKIGGGKSLGFIAQDVQVIYPELVTPEKGDGTRALNYEGLIAPLVGAVQELKQQNDELRKKLQEQALRQEKLEKAINVNGSK